MSATMPDQDLKETAVDAPVSYERRPSNAKEAAAQIKKSPGVERIEAIASVVTTTDRYFIFFGVFLIAYAYGLDGILRYAYQPYATATFMNHSLLSTINTLRAVIAAAAQPTSAKIADVFGRVELICMSVFFYILGTIVEAVSNNVSTFAAGAVIYQIGYTMVLLLVEVIVADLTSTRARLFFSYIPAMPFIINTWVSGEISEVVMAGPGWRWGIGMWCIIYAACAAPLIISLSVVGFRAKRMGKLDNWKSSFELLGAKNFILELFWLLDVIGIILLIAVFALILVPLTTAGGFQDKWKTASVLAPLIIGIFCIPVFIIWELKAPHPLVPFTLMKDRAIWAAMFIAVLFNFAWTMQGDYLYSVLIVAFDFTVKEATRVTSLFSFVSCITGPLLGLVVFKVRRIKVFIVFGTTLFLVAFGLLIRFRGDTHGSSKAGIIAANSPSAQCVLGLSASFFTYPVQASLQAYTKHEHLAVMTGLYLATYSLGSAFGNSVSGSIWTQVLPQTLNEKVGPINETLAVSAYGDPFTAIAEWPVGTPERGGIVASYKHVQRLLTITGICLCVPLICCALCLRNPKLNDAQNLIEKDPNMTSTDREGEAPETSEAQRV